MVKAKLSIAQGVHIINIPCYIPRCRGSRVIVYITITVPVAKPLRPQMHSSCLEGKKNSSFCGMQILWPNHHNITKSYHKIYSKQEDFRGCRKKLTIWPWSPAHLPKPTTISDDSCSAEIREGDEADIGNR